MITYRVTVDEYGTTRWYNEQQLHRLDGPAVEYADGDEFWYQNGKYHRLDGPACVTSCGYKAWWVKGKLHRLDGPAVVFSDGVTKQWWIEGCRYTDEEFKAKIQSMNRPCKGKKVVVDGVEYSLA